MLARRPTHAASIFDDTIRLMPNEFGNESKSTPRRSEAVLGWSGPRPEAKTVHEAKKPAALRRRPVAASVVPSRGAV